MRPAQTPPRRSTASAPRSTAGAAPALLRAASEAELELRGFLVSGGQCVATVPLSNAPDFERVRSFLTAAGGPDFTLARGFGVVSLIGIGAGSDPETLAEALAALPCSPAHVTSSPLALSAVVPEARLAEAERAWHAAFVVSEAQGRAA